MRSSRLKLYLPFLALAVVQAGLMAVAPSVNDAGSGTAASAGFDPNAPVDPNAPAADPNAPPVDPNAPPVDPNAPAADPNAPAADPNAPAPAAAAAAAPAGGGGGSCQGPQQDVTRVSPPCVPPFEGDNGGGTYQGVSGTEVKVVFFASEPNEQVDAILATQGLASKEEEIVAFLNAATKFINERYELYGRTVKLERVVGDCPTTPPDVAACKAAAREVVNKKPFMVLWATPLYPSVFDEFARAGIVSLGGWQFDESLFIRRAPFRYDPVMDGTQSARFIGEYYCKKLAKKPASHSGQIIHPTIGNRDQVPRRLGIVVPEPNLPAAVILRDIVAGCDAQPPVVKTYVSDITTASQQTAATLSALIQGKVTTVACLCDPIAPTFLTNGATGQRYFPEHLLTGFQFQDSDLVGRLYNAEQWKHAFGPVLLAPQPKQEDGDEDRVFRAGGGSGNACTTCGIPWAYMGMMASLLQRAGPNLNPQTLQQGALSTPPQGGTPETPLLQLGQNDFTLVSDVREVFWSASTPSAVDGKAGSYVGLNGNRRYRLGQLPPNLTGVPVEPR